MNIYLREHNLYLMIVASISILASPSVQKNKQVPRNLSSFFFYIICEKPNHIPCMQLLITGAVDAKLSALRVAETDSLWRDGIFPSGVNFRDIKPLIESSAIFNILRGMPKGAILHIHGIGNVGFLHY